MNSILTANKMLVHIRWMIRRDMKEVCAIERESFEFPWFEEEFTKSLRQRNCIGMVAENNEQKIVGFMIYELCTKKLSILNFGVDPAVRLCGIGTQMIDKLIGKLSSQRRTSISLRIRERNLTAQLFFKKSGFICTNVIKKFYDDSPEDSYLFEYFGAAN